MNTVIIFRNLKKFKKIDRPKTKIVKFCATKKNRNPEQKTYYFNRNPSLFMYIF